LRNGQGFAIYRCRGRHGGFCRQEDHEDAHFSAKNFGLIAMENCTLIGCKTHLHKRKGLL